MKLSTRSIVKVFFVFVAALFFNTTVAHSSTSVSLRWDANEPTPEGYRVFARESGSSYNYEHPIWEGSTATCTLIGLTEEVTYYFVVRAYDGDLESVDSDEVSYTPPLADIDFDTNDGDDSQADTDTDSDSSVDGDSDGDNVADSQDMFPNDPDEWADTDGDGIGNNQDTDDDNDGMTDDWEASHGLDPLVDDAQLDSDGDGVTNLDEFIASSGADSSTENTAPQAPVIENASEAERVSLTPVLVCGEYFDSDNDDHYQTRWQISTESDFSSLILDATSTIQLTTYTVGEMVLDVDTVYYWRVQFVDTNNDASDWSSTATYTTITAEHLGDSDLDGVLDNQDAGDATDLNENGIADALENNIMVINTIEGETTVGVETLADTISLVSVKSLSTTTIADQSVALGFGLIGFKLYLQEGVKTASVKIHFSRKVPRNAKLYKYTIETGWNEYENAIFAANRKSVTLVLEDGGVGDEDGVENGVIVDPSGIAYPEDSAADTNGASVSTADAAGGGGGGGCFISTGSAGWNGTLVRSSSVAGILTVLLLTVGGGVATVVRIRK